MGHAVLAIKSDKREDLADLILHGLNSMPEPLRGVFVLHQYKGRSTDEISRELGLGQGEIPGLLSLARAQLFQVLEGFRLD